MKSYLDESFIKQINAYRSFVINIDDEWGGKKRLFKLVNVELEIKFCKAEMLLDESLKGQIAKNKIDMIEMMYRAWAVLISKAEENGYTKFEQGYKCYEHKDNILIVCDSDLQLSSLKLKFGKDKKTLLYSMEELFRFIPPDLMEAKKIFKSRDMDITFKRITHG